jgi:enoyl-CoA hydratase/carnithine racemase
VTGLVDVDVRGHVAVVTMRREEKRNAVDRRLADAIDEALNRLDDDPDLWVGVLTGTDLVFSAGSDLAAAGDYSTARGGEYGIIRRRRRKPLIAAVEGYALGGGFEIVLACDLVVAADDATFGLPEVARGVLPTCGGLFRGPRALPLNVAKELVLTGNRIDARRAERLGLVNVLTEPGGAVAAAVRLAEQIITNAPIPVQASLQAINELVGDSDERGWSATAAAFEQLQGTADMREGITAFFEKRPPRWTGR